MVILRCEGNEWVKLLFVDRIISCSVMLAIRAFIWGAWSLHYQRCHMGAGCVNGVFILKSMLCSLVKRRSGNQESNHQIKPGTPLIQRNGQEENMTENERKN
jgi:hypothetical protein